ncbi:unnamed protein product [marine sediment metagenome]|uniref:Uncharacterized protein n=1 Tax=marine sediment metagenome TaxID=412755 RepID=X1C7Q9_9ZZZZ
MSDVIQIRQLVAAGADLPNIISGDIFEYLTRRTVVRGGIVQDVATGGDLVADFDIGSRIVARGFKVPNEASIGRGVETDKDVKWISEGLPGQRLTCRIVNTDAVNAAIVDLYIFIA